MRFIAAAILAYALAMPAASALPTAGQNALLVLEASPLVQAAKRNRPHYQRHSRSGDGNRHRHSRKDDGIHPLVGSGDY